MSRPCRAVPIELLNEFIRDYLEKRRLPAVRKANVALPIVWFGDSQAFFDSRLRIVTIGLNPSKNEFSECRFDTKIDWAKPESRERLAKTLDCYFNANPYWRWFRWFEAVLKILGASYRPECHENCAVHIDVYSSLATDPTWGGLDESCRASLRRTDLFARLFRALEPDVILLSANDGIRKNLFGAFEPVASAQYQKEDGTTVRGSYVRTYRRNGVWLLTGRNMHGTPFGGMSENWLARTIPVLFDGKQPRMSIRHSSTTNPNNNTTMKTTKHAILRVQDKPTFRTIDEICKATGIDPRSVRRGFLRKPGAPLPSAPGIDLWWPSADSKNWDNHLSEDGTTLWAKSRKEPFSIDDVAAAANAGRLTAVFFREPMIGRGYQFVGVFKTNLEKSRKRLFHVFDRVSDELEV